MTTTQIIVIIVIGIIAIGSLVTMCVALNNHFMWFVSKEEKRKAHWKERNYGQPKILTPKDKLWNRCSICGRFVAFKEIENGEAVVEYTPDTEVTIEQTNVYHKSCLADLHITNKKFNQTLNTKENDNTI